MKFLIVKQIGRKKKLVNVRNLNTTSILLAIASKPSWGPWLIVVGIWAVGLYSRGSVVESLNNLMQSVQFFNLHQWNQFFVDLHYYIPIFCMHNHHLQYIHYVSGEEPLLVGIFYGLTSQQKYYLLLDAAKITVILLIEIFDGISYCLENGQFNEELINNRLTRLKDFVATCRWIVFSIVLRNDMSQWNAVSNQTGREFHELFRSQTRYDTIPEVPLLMPLTNDLLYLFTVLEVMFDIEMWRNLYELCRIDSRFYPDIDRVIRLARRTEESV